MIRASSRVLFLCGTHGNESFSIPVLEKLTTTLPRDKYNYDFIVANPKAVKQKTRFVDIDMNRSAPGNLNSGILEEHRVAEVINYARAFDLVIDIHGAESNCGITTLIPLPTIDNLHLAINLGLKRNIIWYSKNSIEHGPIAQHIGKTAIELECGPKNDPNTAAELYDTLWRFITNKYHAKISHDPSDDQQFYDVYGKLLEEDNDAVLKDFMPQTTGSETFYPYLSDNTYDDIACYKMQRSDLPHLTQKYMNLSQ